MTDTQCLDLFAEELPDEAGEFIAEELPRAETFGFATWGSAGCFGSYSCFGSCAATASTASTASSFA